MMAEKKTQISVSEVSQKQMVLDLKTGQDAEITISYKKFSAEPKTPEELAAALREAEKLVGTKEEVLAALVDFASSKSYQDGKTSALAQGDFLTRELRSKITQFMGAQSQFAEFSAKENFEKWKTGYLGKKPGAKKILEIVRADAKEFDL